MSSLPPVTSFFSQYIFLAPKSRITESWITKASFTNVVSFPGHIVFRHHGDVLARMCYVLDRMGYSIFVPGRCCGNLCFNPVRALNYFL
jgi:hypothetical protein